MIRGSVKRLFLIRNLLSSRYEKNLLMLPITFEDDYRSAPLFTEMARMRHLLFHGKFDEAALQRCHLP
jgi:hypothetical protein